MQPMNRSLLIGAITVGLAPSLANVRAEAGDVVEHLGSAAPHEPILATFGKKRMIAFYEPKDGRCAVHAVVWQKTDAKTGLTTATPDPREVVHIDSLDNKTINLQCGDHAKTLALIDSNNLITARVSD